MSRYLKVILLLGTISLIATLLMHGTSNNLGKSARLTQRGAQTIDDKPLDKKSAQNRHLQLTTGAVTSNDVDNDSLNYDHSSSDLASKATREGTILRSDESHVDITSDVIKWKRVVPSNSPYIDPKLFVNTTGEIKKKHNILMWNAPGWMKEEFYADVDFNQCTYKNCKMVHSQRLFQESSAVMFSVGDLGMGRQPPVPDHLRNPDQAWIFFTLESPIHLGLNDFKSPDWHNSLNWSWTYRTDADIFHPYGILQTRLELPKKNYSEIFHRKSKMAAWAVSHCSTYGKREEYTKLMQKYVPVDIFGGCGNSYPDNFNQLLDNDYRFYLGFENSLCTDYITEKFFQYYKNDLIVVVRGGGSYAKYLPKGSYINADDFPTVKALTDYLQKLAADEEEYIKYLKVKDQFDVKERWYLFRDALCNICDKLNNLESNRKTYKDIVEWFGYCNAVKDLH